MTKQEALDHIREHLTTLDANPNAYEDGTCNIIAALDDYVIPMLEESIKQDRILADILDAEPHAFDRVNVVSPDELKHALGLSDDYRFDPRYTIDEKGNVRLIEVSIIGR